MPHTCFFTLAARSVLNAAVAAVLILPVFGLAPSVPLAASAEEKLRTVSEAELAAMLSQDRDAPLIVVYWASWCTPCRHFRIKMETIRKKHPEAALNILAVSVDDAPERAREYLAQNPLPYPSVICGESLRKSLTGLPVPTTRLYRRDGGLEKELTGDVPLRRLEHYVRRLLGLPPIPLPPALR